MPIKSAWASAPVRIMCNRKKPTACCCIMHNKASVWCGSKAVTRLYSGAAAKKPATSNPLADFFGGVVDWISESTLNMVIAIAGALVIVIALVVGIVAIAGAGDTGDIVKPEDYNQVIEIDKDEYAGVLLEETKDGGKGYINETLFIGDSNFARMPLYSLLTIDNVIGIESMGIEDVTEWKSVYFEEYDAPVSIPEAIKAMKPRRIVLCFGTNNVNNFDLDEYITNYKKALDAIKSAYSYSDVIICAIPPFGEARTNKNLTIDKVNKYNMALIELAKERGLTYLNITEAVSGTNGFMKPNFVSEDGIHFTKAGLEAFLGYVRTHVHDVEDARPTPIGDVPTRKNAPVIVTESEEFDVALVLTNARDVFTEAGHTMVTSLSGDIKASVTYSLPLETKAGEEANAANWFYSYVLKNIKFENGYKSLQVIISGEKTTTEYKFYASVAPAYCTGEHTFAEDTTKSKAATCTAKGVKVEVCSKCGYVKTTELEMLTHTFDNAAATTTKPTGSKAATCGAPGYEYKWCTLCKAWIKVEIPKTGEHSFVEDTAQYKAATCTTVGKRVSVCAHCGETKTEEIEKLAHTIPEYVVTKEPTCTETGLQTGTCSVCGYTETAEIKAKGHTWDGGTVTRAPTETTTGITRFTCTTCGVTEDRMTEKLPLSGGGSSENEGTPEVVGG